MMKSNWRLLSVLTVAMGRTNTVRMIPRSIGQALDHDWPVLTVHLSLDTKTQRHVHEAKQASSGWLSRSATPSVRKSLPSVSEVRAGKRTTTLRLALRDEDFSGELRIQFGGIRTDLKETPGYLEALARIVEVGIGHQLLIQRVADLSRHAHVESRELREQINADASADGLIVARSPRMRAVLERVKQVARFDTTVLVGGESGVGKEVISRLIHRRSSRSRRAFVQLNCGAIPEQLVESELFGHEQGAFTGANRQRRGVFEQANGGILFLDEIGDLPLSAQVKLLRVLQERTFRRVGGEDNIAVDVRVVAATNRSLANMVKEGTFRDDLFYRLSVFPIDVPPLRERSEDLAPLAHALLERLSERLGVGRPRIARATLACLAKHHWPGNVRELANVLEAALIVGGGRVVELPDSFAEPPIADDGPVPTLERSIRNAIELALESRAGKIHGSDGAAVLLDLHPATLQSKMRKLGISRSQFVR